MSRQTNPDLHHTDAGAQLLRQYLPIIHDPEAARFADRRKAALAAYLRQEVTERELECLLLYFVEGYSLQRISTLLSISPSSVSRNMNRGRERIEHVLSLGAELLGQDFIRS
jgi:RNA polymerase sigma factor (sigma-70 family)